MMRFTLDLFPDLPEDATPEQKLEWALSTIKSNPGLAWDISDEAGNVIHENVVAEEAPMPTFRLVHTTNVGTVTECPHCGGVNTIVEVDSAIRFNELEFDDRSGGTRPIAHMGPEGDWDFDHWYCESCGSSDLSAPAQLDIREWV